MQLSKPPAAASPEWTSVIESSTAEIADREAQMDADVAAENAAMESSAANLY